MEDVLDRLRSFPPPADTTSHDAYETHAYEFLISTREHLRSIIDTPEKVQSLLDVSFKTFIMWNDLIDGCRLSTLQPTPSPISSSYIPTSAESEKEAMMRQQRIWNPATCSGRKRYRY